MTITTQLKLSSRESQLARLIIVAEAKDQAIAHELGMTYNTLRTQLTRLYRKLGVQTNTGVVIVVFSEVIRFIICANRIAQLKTPL